jgi:hypothetical protein
VVRNAAAFAISGPPERGRVAWACNCSSLSARVRRKQAVVEVSKYFRRRVRVVSVRLAPDAGIVSVTLANETHITLASEIARCASLATTARSRDSPSVMAEQREWLPHGRPFAHTGWTFAFAVDDRTNARVLAPAADVEGYVFGVPMNKGFV